MADPIDPDVPTIAKNNADVFSTPARSKRIITTTTTTNNNPLGDIANNITQGVQDIGNTVNGWAKDPGRTLADATGFGPDAPFGKFIDQRNADGSRAWAGGPNSVYNQAWDLVTSAHQADAATADTPSTTTPTIQDANTTQLNQQLTNEGRSARSGSIQNTGGSAGLLDQPQTSSRVLLGDQS